MSLTHETNFGRVGGYVAGDMKLAGYDISFTLNQLVEAETGWFLMNGAAISRTTYPILFARFGTTFGPGDGSTTFNLPDFTDGKVPILKGVSSFTSFGASGGEINHTLTTGELASHAHSDSFSVSLGSHGHTGSASINAANGSHTHTFTGLIIQNTLGSSSNLPVDYNDQTTSGTSGSATHNHSASISINNTTSVVISLGQGTLTGSISNSGSGGSHNNMSPYLVMGGWLVKYG